MAIKTLESFSSILAVERPVMDGFGKAYVLFQGRHVNLENLTVELVSSLTTILKEPLYWRIRKLALEILEKFDQVHKDAKALTEIPFVNYFYQFFEVENKENLLLKQLKELAVKFCTYSTGQFMNDFCFTPTIRGSYVYCEEVCVDPDESPWWVLKKEWLRRHLGGGIRPLDPFQSIPDLDSAKHLSFDHWGNCVVFLWGSWMKLDDLTRECIPVLTGMFAVQVWDLNDQEDIVFEEKVDRNDLRLAEAIVLQLQALYKIKAERDVWSFFFPFLPRVTDRPEQELKSVWQYLQQH